MRLRELIDRVPPHRVWQKGIEAMNPDILELHYDSRQVEPGSLFFAFRGEKSDGHDFLPQACRRGAVAIASERPATHPLALPWIQVEAIRPYMALAAHEFHGRASGELDLIGITGTNGKTTTAYLVHSILGSESPALLVGTVQTVIGSRATASQRTTPEATDLQRLLRRAVGRGCRWGALEVSSHALAQYRTYQCRFPIAVFTNLSQDHLDFHGSMEAYLRAKSLLFQHDYNPGLKTAVLNADDPASGRIPIPATVSVKRFSLEPGADAYPEILEESWRGLTMVVRLEGERVEISSPLVGRHNCQNILAAVLACRQLGLEADRIARGVARLASVPGRFERVDLDKPFGVFVDYAHTPDALENLLRLSRQITQGRVLCVFGCGGDRDRSKRSLMGQVASRLADSIFLTSDNPRGEDPHTIIEEIRAGVADSSDCRVLADRREAIAAALEAARPGDVVLIAGKGHETYQEIAGRKLEFDDRRVAREVS